MTAATLHHAQARAMSEAALLEQVRSAVRALGGFFYHTHDSRRSTAGFPDLAICVPRYRLAIFRELKSERGKCSLEQMACLDTMAACGLDVGVWRPSDWLSGRITRELTGQHLERRRAALARLLHCSQCGGSIADRACGPTHAVLAADPLRHRELTGEAL